MAQSARKAELMIEAAASGGSQLMMFHNYRYECDYLEVRRVIASGALGEILAVRLCVDRFSRRHDWQAVSRLGGGVLRVTAWHLIDLALDLVQVDVTSAAIVGQAVTALSPGDAEDYGRVIIDPPGGPLIDVHVSAVSAFPQDKWFVEGTRGTLRGTHDTLTWRFVDVATLRPLVVDEGPAPERAYDFDQVAFQEHHWEAPFGRRRAAFAFYADLADRFRDGRPPAAPAEHGVRIQRVLDAVLEQSAAERARCGDVPTMPRMLA